MHPSIQHLRCLLRVNVGEKSVRGECEQSERIEQSIIGECMKITKAIIPAAGHGTRFLPYTKAVPKEMVPLLNKPAIQYIVQEIADAGLGESIMITAAHKQAIAKHFGKAPELESFLKAKNKLSFLDELNKLIASIKIDYVIQHEAKGLGHAVSLARKIIGNEYFGILLPDDIMISEQPGIKQLIDIAQKENASVLAVQEVSQESISSYGVIAFDKQINENLFQIRTVVEKPDPQNAPSNLAIIGRYVLSPQIFKALDAVSPAANGEIQLTDGIAKIIADGNKVLAYKIKGTRYDVGTPVGWLKANFDLAQQNHQHFLSIK